MKNSGMLYNYEKMESELYNISVLQKA